MKDFWLQMLLLMLVFLCALTDLHSGRIRNAVVMTIGAAGAGLRIMTGGPEIIPVLILSAGIPFLVLYPFWKATGGKGIGAGDIKLLMAVAVMAPALSLLPIYAVSFISAGIYGIFHYLIRQAEGETPDLQKKGSGGHGIHMAVFIAAGTCLHIAGLY